MTTRLSVDWIKCKAHGLCYELFTERIRPDDWGYPIIDESPIPASMEPLARRSADACPTLALPASHGAG